MTQDAHDLTKREICAKPGPVSGVTTEAVDSKESAGAPANSHRRTVLPNGLDWDTVVRAVEIIEEWELQADGMATA